jgi:hypothetical protein
MSASPQIEPARRARLQRFLADAGWGDAVRSPLSGDASFRRYERLSRAGRQAILMDAPPTHENVQAFVRIATLLKRLGLSAPEILARDMEGGFLLLEDLGDETFTRALSAGQDEGALYRLAIDTLVALHDRVTPADLESLPVFDDTRALREVSLLLDWYWPAIHGAAPPAPVRSAFEAAWREVLPLRNGAPETVALFDFHVDNLMRLPRPGTAACGLLDFQDAVRAPCVFDLVSLLEDVRRVVPASLQEEMIERYLSARPALAKAEFMKSYAVIGAQRNTRIAGTFTRLLVRDGKSGYQRFMPRVWTLISTDLSAPVLAPVADWYARHLPSPDRRSLTAQHAPP